MRMRALSLLLGAAAAAGALFTAPDASACGGCFPPQGEQNSIVTDHRMVMSVSTTRSTLYDQIKYQGNPSEFAWVLPTVGTVEIGISSDSLFQGLDTLTSVVVTTPPTNCPVPPASCYENQSHNDSATSAGGFGGSADGGAGVSVIASQVVGPYETVQLHPNSTTDTASVEKWLTDHNFVIPADVKPIIAKYVSESFNFLALRLKPGADVKSMRPVRVTTQGANVALPLRMVAAGTGANVGITAWIVSQGRYEPTNFQSFVIKDEELAWDWGTNASNYKDLRAQKSAIAPGKMWEIESSITTAAGQIQNAARFASRGVQNGDYIDYVDGNGVSIAAKDAMAKDFSTLLDGLGGGQLHVTRIRADLSRAALASDLSIGASQDQSDIPRTRQPKLEKGQPLCTVYKNCVPTGVTLPRDQAIAQNAGGDGPLPGAPGSSSSSGSSKGTGGTPGGNDNDGTFTCGATRTSSTTTGASVGGALVALAVARIIRRRRARRA